MTALKPIENRLVVGVPSSRYPLNEFCSQPDCGDLTQDPHHCFPRSQIGNDSWFVAISDSDTVIPHVTGLCRAHHDDVEEHRSWIRLEEDGQFVWYDRATSRLDDQPYTYDSEGNPEWELIGSLDPQPARGEKSRKPRLRLRGEERRKRKRVSIALPDDWEDGGALWDELVDDVKDWLWEEGLYGDRSRIPIAESIFAMWHDWKQLRKHTPREESYGIEPSEEEAVH